MAEIYDAPSSPRAQMSPGRRRHRFYFLALDAATLGLVLLLLDVMRSRVLGWEWYSSLSDPVLITGGIVVAVLIFGGGLVAVLGKPLRDEYAEGLWKRTAEVMIYVLAIAPPMVLIGGWAYYGLFGEGAGVLRPLYEQVLLFDLSSNTWKLFLGLFVIVMQILRLKDSR